VRSVEKADPLAYAQRYPARVSEIVIAGVTTSRRAEIDWLYRDACRLLPGSGRRSARSFPRPSATVTSSPPTRV
jgi:hypothetical protein